MRTSDRLIALLEREGFRDVEIYAAKGHYRSSPYADVVRWEGYAKHGESGCAWNIYSWDTMTECVKRGVTVSEKDRGTCGIGFEVFAKTHAC